MFAIFLNHVRTYANSWTVGVTIVFCTIVATILTFLNGQIWMNYVVSYTIGVTCMSVQMWAHRHRPPSWNREWVTVIAGIISLVLALLLGGTLGAFDPLFFFQRDATGLVIGGSACIVAAFLILLVGHIRDLEAQRDAAQRSKLINERELATAQLRTLQAQIEPHFLFNTLANVHSLIETDPKNATELLDSLVQLLRISLAYSRSVKGTVSQEIELISHYLDVQKIRIGDRLSYEIQVEAGVGDRTLQPFLIQPLVENAIKHGIEPTEKPGRLSIEVSCTAENLTFAILNTTPPLTASTTNSTGMGIANIRERMVQVYGENASLDVAQLETDEFRAVLTIPAELKSQSA